jgi:hypothetical protein
MKDEIKEMIDKTKKCLIAGYDLDIITQEEMGILWNYITNLQEENERLKADYEKEVYLVDKLTRQLTDEYKNTEYQCRQKEDYKSRNEKAIEYNKTHYVIDEPIKFKNDLLDILQGEDKDDN